MPASSRRLLLLTLIFISTPWSSRAETISGVVSVTPGGTPLSGAVVEATFEGAIGAAFFATSLGDGGYVLNLPPVGMLPSNRFRLRARANDFFNLVHPSSYCMGPCVFSLGTTVVVPAGSNVTNIDFAMRALPLATVNGSVVDAATAAPLSGIRVAASHELEDATLLERDAFSAGDGSYSLSVIAGVPFRLRAIPGPGGRMTEHFPERSELFGCSVMAGDLLSLNEGQVRSASGFSLSFPGSASGAVSSITLAAPIAGAEIDFVASDGQICRSAPASSGGAYSVALPPAIYRARVAIGRSHLRELWNDLPCTLGCDVSAGAPIPVAANVNTGGVDFALVLGGSISGSTGVPFSSINHPGYALFDANGVLIEFRPSDSIAAFQTDVGLPSGNYFVRTSPTPLGPWTDLLYEGMPCNPDCDALTGTPVAVVAGSDTPLISPLNVSPGCHPQVRMLEAASQAALQNATLEIYAANGNLIDDNAYRVDAFGNVQAANALVGRLAEGQYFLKARSAQHVDELFDGIPCEAGCQITSGIPVTCTGFTSFTSPAANFNLELIIAIFADGFD